MDAAEQARFERLYQQHLLALKTQGKRPKTIDAYSRALRRLRDQFDCCPDTLTPKQLRWYFAELVDSHSWSTVKLDRCGLQFFYAHVLERDWDWVRIVKPPQVRRLPDIFSIEELARLLRSVRRLRFRVFFLTTYSLGLRLGEALQLQVGDIDAGAGRVHVRDGKGGKDRLVPLPDLTLSALRACWRRHRHPRWLFPAPKPDPARSPRPMDRGGVQAALKAALVELGIARKLSVHSLRHSYATHLLEAGVDLRQIQTLLGHASPITTARYTQLTEVGGANTRACLDQLMHRLHQYWRATS
jgi:integrase/recombinase XerD